MDPDPWYDFLAIPVAPVVLMSQFAAMALPSRTPRRVIVAGASAAIVAMTTVVLAIPAEGANIGAGLIVPQAVISLALTAVEFRKGH